jgi:hypothetical protein
MNAPLGVLAEHGAWMFEMRMLRAETPDDGISAACKYWTSASPRELSHQGISYPVYPQWARCRLLGTFETSRDVRSSVAIVARWR